MPRRYAETSNRVFHSRQPGADGIGIDALSIALDLRPGFARATQNL
jgi:hypothetical protein